MSVLVKLKPTSAGLRHAIKLKKRKIYKGRPIKHLIEIKKKHGGRNNKGRITVRHVGGGHKKYYRKIDFKRKKDNITARVERIEYDPNRNAMIALIKYKDGERSYIISNKGMKIGSKIESGNNVAVKIGNCLPLKNIHLGTKINCIELKPGKGAKLVRSAGNYAQIISRDGRYVIIRLRSGEIRKINSNCRGTIGEINNAKYNLCKLGKAGAKRWKGIRPTVRGVAMNPVDHPHGGGEGRTSGGRHPVSPWGKPTKGYKTRKNKMTNKFIVRKR
ncbi:50S ribosomal protein L2 [Candidatus Portiera aleyrodidarum]|uniref:Large ribosomal subunit protein uL2 n=1 Tax=Candidatus Portiera aleyrodidarum TaxID=91844 RepID=A0A8D9NAV8_9GAMM|nr:50S ribosomal protein L2 [Candidatus Portiera aleyrodidarum]CEI58698.1 50S ribosomal protein L2 [Candidatus Portiera aleyrodidarum]